MRRPAVALAALAVLAITSLPASTPAVWEHPPHRPPSPGARETLSPSGPLDRDGRRADGVSIGETGAISLSAPLREIFPGGSKVTPPPVLWMASADQSGNLYVGSGNTGEVYRIDRKGTTVSTFDTDEMGVRAVVASVTGDLYVGTFPAGGVYRIKSSGKVEPWFDPEDRYIWAMAINNADDLVVATGERGIIYQVLGQSEGKPIFDSEEAHITAMAFDRAGQLLAGTAPNGLVYRVGPEGRAETLLDSGLNEISALTVTPEGVIYAAAMGEEPPQAPRKPGEKSDLTIEVTPAPDGSILEEEADKPRKITIDLAELTVARPSVGEGSTGRIYRLAPGHPPALAWKSDVERVFSLAWSAERGLVFGTGGSGTEGRIYRLEQDGTASMLHQLREPQVTSLLANPDGRIYACTSNPGRVYVLDTGTSASGSYLSSVYDAGQVAQWGSIGWDADTPPGTRIEIATRSGNRSTPDNGWSAWSPPYALEKGSQVASPPARYLQWKAEMSRLKTESAPLLRRVKVTLLPANRPPTVRGVRVLETGVAVGKDAVPVKGSRWVTWTSSDPDDDRIAHTIWLRPAKEAAFRKVADQINAPPYALGDGELAEGRYVIKVEADDVRTNGTLTGLNDSEVSDPFTVDHSPPTLETKQAPAAASTGRLTAEITAADAVGTVARGEIYEGGEGGGSSILLPCRDGICDTSSESFLIDVPDPGAGRRITVRIYDAAGNMASVEIPGGSRKGDK